MKIVLLSGGSGRRLWPLSNGYRSKQYLMLLEGLDGELESMVQRLWRQLAEADLQEYAYFSTCKQQADVLQEQIGVGTPLIIEPEQRDTFAAAGLAAAYLYSVAAVSLNETIVVIPVDTFVESDFFQCVRSLPKLLRESGSELLMIGMKPGWVTEQYGYILPEDNLLLEEEMLLDCGVHLFKEKPVELEAKALVERGALWNSGVYAFRLNYLITLLMQRGLPLQYDDLYHQYSKLPKNSFEKEVVEREVSKSVVRYDSLWKDFGSWKSLSESLAAHKESY